MLFLLDTNVCIAVMRGNAAVAERLRGVLPDDCGVSSVTIYELYSGIERCKFPAQERQKVERFVNPLHLVEFDQMAAMKAASIRWHLQKRGMLIGPYDLMLAGQALALDLTLVTHNWDEFSRVPGLKIVDWQA